MKHYRLLAVVALVACMTLILTVSLVQAQTGVTPNGLTGGGGGPVSVGTGFTYQGRLKNAAGPVNGTCDFQFSLWDRSGTGTPPAGGVQIGATDSQSGVAVNDGLFDVILNFENQFGPTAFTGDARWLQIAVRCPAGGIGFYTTLSPRQPLWATPYALSLMPSAVISGSLPGNTTLAVKNNALDGAAVAGRVYGGSGIEGLAVAITGTNYGVMGRAASPQGYGGYFVNGTFGGQGGGGTGVYGESDVGTGVYGWSGDVSIQGPALQRPTGGGGGSIGVYGFSSMVNGVGVKGVADSGVSAKGIYGYSHSGYAGYFDGNVRTLGNITATGAIYGAAKYFLIDHPLDPANKYLVHTSVESPDMKNVYDGVVVLDKNGEAVVTLPDWFEALNRDFRYQLTCIGGYAPIYIAEEVQHNTFTIAGGKPGLKVSWQITGIRQDPWANDHRVPVESDKPAGERGTYLYPEGYAQTPEVK